MPFVRHQDLLTQKSVFLPITRRTQKRQNNAYLQQKKNKCKRNKQKQRYIHINQGNYTDTLSIQDAFPVDE